VGLVGAPNAGKSSLLRRLTRARPKVAAYPFTTLEPVLGTIEDERGRQLVLADIPGLIEGASEGAGLGHEFLAHVERTRLLVQLVDVAPPDGLPPAETYEAVRAELQRYGSVLHERPFLLVLSKVDLLPADEIEPLLSEWRGRLARESHVCRKDGEPVVVAVSSATGVGLDALESAIFSHAGTPLEQELAERGTVGTDERPAEHAVYRPAEETGYQVRRSGPDSFEISGPVIERLVARHDLENAEALAYIEERLKTMGVIKALESQGFEPGQEITIGEVAFDLYPGVAHPE
jgi:GTPase